MNSILTLLDFTAIIVQLIGSWIMFKNSPENRPEGSFIGADGPDYKTPKRRNSQLKRGFLILAVGFLIALISMALKLLTGNSK